MLYTSPMKRFKGLSISIDMMKWYLRFIFNKVNLEYVINLHYLKGLYLSNCILPLIFCLCQIFCNARIIYTYPTILQCHKKRTGKRGRTSILSSPLCCHISISVQGLCDVYLSDIMVWTFVQILKTFSVTIYSHMNQCITIYRTCVAPTIDIQYFAKIFVCLSRGIIHERLDWQSEHLSYIKTFKLKSMR